VTPERWQEIKTVLEDVIQMDAGKRSIYLDQACSSDLSLRREVESLLAVDEELQSGFLRSPLKISREDVEHDRSSWIGRRIGAYEITAIIGEGGMGTVYRALRADEQYQKQVAIKVVKSGFGSSLALARFRAERQILANLEHPNIARLLDGGATEDGLPFVVMELIEGLPIDEYCETRGLSIEERLELFRAVCLAVQYAHQHLVVHRDLKPGNILVTANGVPKLLDFGIAKILDKESLAGLAEPTVSFLRMLTPEYASPEQVRGETVTTTSDVYSLGVVLYLLLTGRHPYLLANHSADAIVRAVCDTEPLKPSSAVLKAREIQSARNSPQVAPQENPPTKQEQSSKLSKRLRGDLDNIVLMALQKDPQRRYASAEQLAEDIRRHLENLPVVARTDTARYRTSKFVTRHKIGVMATVLVAFVLVAALLVTIHEARVAREQSARAERRFNDVRTLANSLIFEIHDSVQDIPGATAARRVIVARALQYLDSLSAEQGNDLSLTRELAAAYQRLGDVQGYFYRANLGDTAGAESSYQKALAMRRRLAAAEPGNATAQGDLAGSLERVGQILDMEGRDAEAISTYREALAIRGALVKSDPASESARARLASSQSALADVSEANPASQLDEYHQSLAGYHTLSVDYPQNPEYQRMSAILQCKIGLIRESAGDLESARQDFQSAVALLDPLSHASSTSILIKRNFAFAHTNLGGVLCKQRDKGCFKELLVAISVDQELAKADPQDHRIQRDLVFGYRDLGDAERIFQNSKLAFEYYTKSLAIAETRATHDPQNVDAGMTVASCNRKLGEFFLERAADRKGTKEERVLWISADRYFQNALHFWIDPERQPSLTDENKNAIQSLKNQIAECEKNLASLHSHDQVRDVS
jgi:non-specific serine/threonine protein kinase/serine/threonine-protein kinase